MYQAGYVVGAVVAAALGIAGTAAKSQEAGPPSAPVVAIQTIDPILIAPISLDRSNRMTLPVHIGGHGPFSFIVDSGSERTVVSTELASQLALPSAGRARIISMAEVSEANLFRATDLRLSELLVGDRIVPAFGQTNLGAPGLIGIDSLEGHRLVIDFVAGRMDIRPAGRAAPRREPEFTDSDVITVTARRRAGRLILSNAQVNGRRIDMVIDTGAQSSVGNQALRRMMGNHGRALPRGQLTSVTGAVLTVDVGEIDRIAVGGVDFTNLPVAYADSPAFAVLGLAQRPALLLGMDALRLFDRVAIDFSSRRVTFDLPDQVRGRTDGRWADYRPYLATTG